MDSLIRRIQRTIDPVRVTEGAGVRLRRAFPTRSLDFPDPFLLFDHFGSDDPADYMAGFPMHPHRGIETVTYMLAGAVAHRDSLGNRGVIEAGDVQWMTAGGGILHEEMPQNRGGRMEGFQLWVNLPARLKMTAPRYQEVLADTIPALKQADGVTLRVIAGEIAGVRGPVTEIAANPLYLDVTTPPGVRFAHSVPRDHTVLLYVYRGSGSVAGAAVHSPQMLLLEPGDLIEVVGGAEELRFLLMAGQADHEPIVRYGPFVMNTAAEIEQALEDLRTGKFVRR